MNINAIQERHKNNKKRNETKNDEKVILKTRVMNFKKNKSVMFVPKWERLMVSLIASSQAVDDGRLGGLK